MILDTMTRAKLFGKALALNPFLGAIFQNPMEITPEMILEEINEVRRLRDQEHERFSNYLVSLRQVRMEIENAQVSRDSN
jgi:hypothetical protein